jgi:HlyD family secretion protein
LLGYAEGEYVRVAAPLGGQLETLAVRRGERIEKGARLFALEQARERSARDEIARRLQRAEAQLADLQKGQRPTEIAAMEAQLRQARSALDLAERQLTRQIALSKQNLVARDTLDAYRSVRDRERARVEELNAALATARLGAREDAVAAALAQRDGEMAALAQADWNLAQKTVTAPVAGLVTDYYYQVGEWVPAGRPIVEVLPPENIKIRCFVPEPRLSQVRAGTAVRLNCDGCKVDLRGEVAYVSPEAEYTPPVIYSAESRQKLVYLVEVKVQPEIAVELHPGQPVTVSLP